MDVAVTVCPPQASPPIPARVAPRHMIGKLCDPLHKLRLRISSDADPFSSGSRASALLATLKTNGLRRFFAEGGTTRLVNQFIRRGLMERVND